MRAKYVIRSIIFWSFYIVIKSNTLHYKMTCGPDQEYNDCQNCEKTCSNPNPSCNNTCVAGCFCKDGLVRAPSGKCVTLDACPKAEVTLNYSDLTIEECLSDEVFVWCGWCEGTCAEPKPNCPDICTRGCICQRPLLRHHSGNCVEETACTPKGCKDPNEEYGCRYGCEAKCGQRLCDRPRRCRLGCHCKLGWFKDSQGKCVTFDQCREQLNVSLSS